MTALGANGAALAVAAAGANIAIAIACQILLRTEGAFWRQAGWVAGLFALMILWLAAPVILPGMMEARRAVMIAPDLVEPASARLMGLAAALLAAAMIGYRHGLMRFSVDMLLLFAIGHIVLALLMRSADPSHVWGFDKGLLLTRFTGTFLNANASGCLFGVFAVLACGRGLGLMRERSVQMGEPYAVARLSLYLIAFIVSIGACLITQSRAALTLTFVLLAGMLATNREIRRFATTVPGRVAIGVAAFLVIAMLAVAADEVIDRFTLVGQDTGDRVMIWSHYWHLARDAIGSGYGPLSFAELNVRHLGNPAEAATFWYINAPHNIALSLLIEGGWPYLALWIMLFGGMAMQIRRGRRSERRDVLARAIVAACILIVGCAMVDIALDVPAMAGLLMILTGFVWGRSLRRLVEDRLVRGRRSLPNG